MSNYNEIAKEYQASKLQPWRSRCSNWKYSRGPAVAGVPLPGTVDPQALGMPLFTLAIGLVDGFNPCAMWVLLLLLSILVNVQDRLRIVAAENLLGGVMLFQPEWLG